MTLGNGIKIRSGECCKVGMNTVSLSRMCAVMSNQMEKFKYRVLTACDILNTFGVGR